MPINIARRKIVAALASAVFPWSLPARAQQEPDPRVSDLVRNGKLRVGLGLANRGSAIKDPATGELLGVAADLARALAARIGIKLQPVEYPRPGAVLDGAPTNAWDVAFLVIDPARSEVADFSPPYMQSDFTFLVPSASPIRKVADADQPGIRIGVPRGDAVDLVADGSFRCGISRHAPTAPSAAPTSSSTGSATYMSALRANCSRIPVSSTRDAYYPIGRADPTVRDANSRHNVRRAPAER